MATQPRNRISDPLFVDDQNTRDTARSGEEERERPRGGADRPTSASVWLPLAFVTVFVVTGVPALGWPVVLVIGTGDLLALAFWIAKGRFHVAGRQMLPFHVATMAGLHLHVYEELTRGFAPAMRDTFHLATFSDATFLNGIVFAVPIMYMLAAIGLWFRRHHLTAQSLTVMPRKTSGYCQPA